MRPDHGGRLVLRLEGEYAEWLDYDIELYVPDAEWRSRARLLRGDGSVSLDPWPANGEPPAWLVNAVHTTLRSVWRSHNANGSWPRRVTRWRAGPARVA